MSEITIKHNHVGIDTADGRIDTHICHPSEGGPWPAVIMYMDGFGIRQELLDMAKQLATRKYYVALPNLYYRSGEVPPFDIEEAFSGGPELQRLMSLVMSIDNNMIMSDTAAILEYLGKQAEVDGEKTGCVGYCMGAQFSLSAAGTYPDRIAAAAMIHGASLATDQPDSPHLSVGKIKAPLYIAIAQIDDWFSTEEQAKLKAAMDEAGISYKMETYRGAVHGFAVNGTPAYKKRHADQHWRELFFLFRKAFDQK